MKDIKRKIYQGLVKVASVNFHAVLGDKTNNLQRMEGYIASAANQGIDLIVFPEVSLTGYNIPKEKKFDYAETIPGPSTERVMEIASKNNLYVVFGMPENGEDEKVYNAAVLISPDGILGKYRKVHIPVIEPWAAAWDEYPVFETRFGRIGLAICWENYCFPEVPRIFALKGAQMLINLTATPDFGNAEDTRRSTFAQLSARVHENGFFIISADLVGKEEDTCFVGYSAILGPSPELMYPKTYAGPASGSEEEMLTATLDMSFTQRRHPGLEKIFDKRRPETYTALT